MTESCDSPLSRAQLLDYLAGTLGETEGAVQTPEALEELEGRIESHLFRCAACCSKAERLAGLLTAVAAIVPPVLSSSRFAALDRRGRIGAINPMRPGQVIDVFYPEAGKLLVHRLGGAELSGVQRIDIDLSDSSGQVFLHLEKVPFDPARGEVLVACQRHFADLFPRDIVFSVQAVSAERREEVARYAVHHQLA